MKKKLVGCYLAILLAISATVYYHYLPHHKRSVDPDASTDFIFCAGDTSVDGFRLKRWTPAEQEEVCEYFRKIKKQYPKFYKYAIQRPLRLGRISKIEGRYPGFKVNCWSVANAIIFPDNFFGITPEFGLSANQLKLTIVIHELTHILDHHFDLAYRKEWIELVQEREKCMWTSPENHIYSEYAKVSRCEALPSYVELYVNNFLGGECDKGVRDYLRSHLFETFQACDQDLLQAEDEICSGNNRKAIQHLTRSIEKGSGNIRSYVERSILFSAENNTEQERRDLRHVFFVLEKRGIAFKTDGFYKTFWRKYASLCLSDEFIDSEINRLRKLSLIDPEKVKKEASKLRNKFNKENPFKAAFYDWVCDPEFLEMVNSK
ncbi:MAG TPA: hypothetical protein PLM85_12415 [Nitrosomonas sp.]|nr:hypothetical protein [Nitrosomonas sp.]HNC91318.1 hypothetical protein [Anaerolineales bacterium]